MYMLDFGERLKYLRNERGYTQNYLAKKMDVSQNTIVRWENGYKSPTKDHLIKLADLLHVSLDYLVGIDTKRSIVVEDITQDQINVLNRLILEFQTRKNGTGLTQRQVEILNDVIKAFTE